MLKDALVGFPVLWRSSIPSRFVVIFVMDTESRQIANHISTRAAGTCVSGTLEKGTKGTNLPRGVVSPMPLYMVVVERKAACEDKSTCASLKVTQTGGTAVDSYL